MTPQEFFEAQLNKLREANSIAKIKDAHSIEAEILRLLLSKKFRKYAANEELIDHCNKAISLLIAENKPINITFLHGAYKLWRLEESPYADWAELFSLMYYTNWAKGICDIYEPGVWFDFFVDDSIVPKLDNIPISDVERYVESFQEVINFLKAYQPSNLKMTITPVSSQFSSSEEFNEILERNLSELKQKFAGKLPALTDSQRAMVELNVKITPEQEKDPSWREKVWQLHGAYMATKRMANYHFRSDKILAFTQPLPSGTTISVGTTKSSIAKFWVGVGALKRSDDSYKEIILSPSQLASTRYEWEEIKIDGLKGKNFNRIRVVD
ncbi:MAG: hypothetical protein WC848_01455 [Parcubacteria group bacterium]|jgi:hypothetical protein